MRCDICCIGHITLDKIVTPESTVYMPGGTAFYFSHAVANLEVTYLLVTALADSEQSTVADLQKRGIAVKSLPSKHTVFFENRYNEGRDKRTQKVLRQADPFRFEQLDRFDAKVFHLGPLLAGDMTTETIKALSAKGKVSLDVQGLLREVQGENVVPVDWNEKKTLLPFVHYLKANEDEMRVITGEEDVYKGLEILASWGVKEAIATLAGHGSVVYSENKFYCIPAFTPLRVEDATGCGDTYMAGYLSQRLKGAGVQQAGEFAAAMATLKIGTSGPFKGNAEDVLAVVKKANRCSPAEKENC